MKVESISLRYGPSIVLRRSAAFLIDTLLAVLPPAALPFLLQQHYDIYRHGKLHVMILLPFALIFSLLYYAVLEGLAGLTIGKLLCRLRVVDAEGRPPGFRKALLRTLIKFFELYAVFPAGGLAVLISGTKQRIGDMAAGTFVLRAKDVKIPPRPEILKSSAVAFFVLCILAIAALDVVALTSLKTRSLAPALFGEQPDANIISSDDGRTELILPNGWSKDDGFLRNTKAQIKAINYREAMFFAGKTYPKDSFPGGTAPKDLISFINRRYLAQSRNAKSIAFNGHRAYQFETVIHEGINKMHYLFTILETGENFHILIAWASENPAENKIAGLKKITACFRERD